MTPQHEQDQPAARDHLNAWRDYCKGDSRPHNEYIAFCAGYAAAQASAPQVPREQAARHSELDMTHEQLERAESRLALAAKVIDAAKRMRAGLKVRHSWEEIDTFDTALAEFERDAKTGETAKKSPID